MIRSHSARRRRDDDDDDDVDNDKFRRSVKKRPKKSDDSKMPLILIGVIGGGVLLLLGCGAVGLVIVLVMKKEQPGPDIVIIDPPKEIPQGGNPQGGNPQGGNPQGGKPPNNPVGPPANQVMAPAVRLRVDAVSEVKDMVFAPQAQGVAYLYWDSRGPLKKYVDYWDWKAGKRLAHIELADDGQYMNLSPRGTRLLVQKQFSPSLNVWSLPDGQNIINDWEPYPRDPKKPFAGPVLAWAHYLDENSLLTVASSGQFDLWNMNGKQVINTSPPRTKFYVVDAFSRSPNNFALSPDGKVLALISNDGFDFLDPRTGRVLGKTEPGVLRGVIGNSWGLSFNRAGTMLAWKGNRSNGGKLQDLITAWEVPSGKTKYECSVPLDFNLNGPINWLGSRHLLIMDGNIYKGQVFSLANGRYQRSCKINSIGDRFARMPPDDRMWFACRAGFGAPADLVAVDFPENDIVQRPAPPGALPVWTFGETGILR